MNFLAAGQQGEIRVTSENQAEAGCEASYCLACRHSVEVRGMDDVVCLAHLTVRHPASAGACIDFESKNSRAVESVRG